MANDSQNLAKGLFKKLKETKPRLDSNWFKEGIYLLQVNAVKVKQNRKGQTGFFIEGTIIAVIDDADGAGHRVGEEVSHSMWEHHESFLGNVKAFLAAATNESPSNIGEEQAMLVIGEDQPLQDTVLECHNRVIQTKAGKDFTLINYKREVPITELAEVLPEEHAKQFFPNGKWEKLLAWEAQKAG